MNYASDLVKRERREAMRELLDAIHKAREEGDCTCTCCIADLIAELSA